MYVIQIGNSYLRFNSYGPRRCILSRATLFTYDDAVSRSESIGGCNIVSI